MNEAGELINQLKATAAELESVWKHLSSRPNIHVQAARNLIARIELEAPMGDDYKYDMQLIAEQIAEDRYGKDFYQLSDDLQYEVFMAATQEYSERAADRADYLRKAERENG